ncbi:ABC transporter ATP-binding protein [Taibaiella koreensis]|uniref:ABC transporter ATP-binding protein n=1 Tax=Taibaiella koreensis TaxID=1268548 RepID=UPI000E59BE99|nr:ABC transporter ATP-binding protein [Taibaiella koreensis]
MNEPGTAPAIELINVSKSYDRPVLHNINLTIPQGQVTGYIGANGAGKSTTVKILTGLITAYEGQVNIMGKDFRQHTQEQKALIGYIPENAVLYEMLTPVEYLQFIGGLYNMQEAVIEDRGRRMLDMFGLSDALHQRMDGFSKGMKQKVLITSALLHDPQIILMDEPLSGLDANAVILLKEIIGGLKKAGKTILYCSHIMDVVEKVSDRIVLIRDGYIMADGTMSELRAQAGTESLEDIFALLTGRDRSHDHGSDFISIFNKEGGIK